MAVSGAGPGFGFGLGGICFAIASIVERAGGVLPALLLEDILWANVGWGLVNLLPILPLDGGGIMRGFVGSERAASIVSVLGVAAVCVLCLWIDYPWGAVIALWYAAQNGQTWYALRRLEIERPLDLIEAGLFLVPAAAP